MFTPYKLAFIETDDVYISSWEAIEYFIDFCFLIDIILNFFTAIYEEEFMIVDDNKVINFSNSDRLSLGST